jgi:hypothetical protein
MWAAVIDPWICAMRCLRCGDEMGLVEAVQDKTVTVTRCERHMFECSGCGEIEYRLIFTNKGPIRRNVQIVHNPDREPAYAAKDSKSGMVVMRQQDRERLRSLCEWIGWRVVGGTGSAAAGAMKEQLQTSAWTQVLEKLPSGSESLPTLSHLQRPQEMLGTTRPWTRNQAKLCGR